MLDVGCGTGFHLPRFAERAARSTGVEPHPDLVALARRRTRRLANVAVRQGTAQALPLPDASVDVVHARWAYFFGPGCEPGLAELDRVVRRGGTAFVIDNDPTPVDVRRVVPPRLPDGRPGGGRAVLVAAGLDPDPGGHRAGRSRSRADLESVVRIEFTPGRSPTTILAGHDGTEVDYAVNLWSRSF